MGLTAGNIARGGRVQQIDAMDDDPIPIRVGDVVECDDGRRAVIIAVALVDVEVVVLDWPQATRWLPLDTVRRARHRTPMEQATACSRRSVEELAAGCGTGTGG